MQTWEYLFVFAAITSGGGGFRPREASDQELTIGKQVQPCTTMQTN
jgi:hypothetical protein